MTNFLVIVKTIRSKNVVVEKFLHVLEPILMKTAITWLIRLYLKSLNKTETQPFLNLLFPILFGILETFFLLQNLIIIIKHTQFTPTMTNTDIILEEKKEANIWADTQDFQCTNIPRNILMAMEERKEVRSKLRLLFETIFWNYIIRNQHRFYRNNTFIFIN